MKDTVFVEIKIPEIIEAVMQTLKEEGNLVEVVRCKDCKYYQRDLMWGHGYCYGQKRKEDWFCADGRRRDDGNN